MLFQEYKGFIGQQHVTRQCLSDWQPMLYNCKEQAFHLSTRRASFELSKMLPNGLLCPDLKCGDICVLLCLAINNCSLCKVLWKDVLNNLEVQHIFTVEVILKDLQDLV